MTRTSSTLITGLILVKISASIPTSVTTYDSTRAFVRHHQRLRSFLCFLRICLTIVAQGSLHQLTPPIKRLTQPTVNASKLPSHAGLMPARPIYPMFPFGSATLTPLLHLVHMLPLITKFPVWHSKSCGLVGQCTHLVEATSLQPSHLAIFPFASNSHVINTNQSVPCFGSSLSVQRFSIMGIRYWTTFADPGITPISMVISLLVYIDVTT
jgi:hypothetical protein